MPGTCQDAANIATRYALNKEADQYVKLSSKMCWDAIIYVAVLAGVIDEKRYKLYQGKPELLAPYDPRSFFDRGSITNFPGGHAIVFYEIEKHTLTFDGRGKLTKSSLGGGHHAVHAMITVGIGIAAGNKNDCIGPGHSVGWELLDLANDLPWSGFDIHQTKNNHRTLRACHRPITEIGR